MFRYCGSLHVMQCIDGNTVLLKAILFGQLELVEWLLLNGCSVLEHDNTGATCIILASNTGFLDMIQLLCWIYIYKL